MPHVVYELKEGKVNRKTYSSTGEVQRVRLQKGARFVPSPSELAANKDRLTPVALAADDSIEVRIALLNTNLRDNPQLLPASQEMLSKVPLEVPQQTKITAMSAEEAVRFCATVASLDELDMYLLQEAANTPRVRKRVLKALEDRRIELGDMTVEQALEVKGRQDE